MKKDISKTVHVVVFFAMMLLSGPFIKVANETVEEAISTGGTRHVTYDKLSGFDIIIETTTAFCTGALKGNARITALIVIAFAVVLLVQFIGALARKGNMVLYSAIALFTALFCWQVYILRNEGPVTLRWGYYGYLLLQALLIIIAGNKKPKRTL